MAHRQPRAIALTPDETGPRKLSALLSLSVAVLALALTATLAKAQEGEVITSHGYTNFGELKYQPGDTLDYVNPDAPGGGEYSTWSIGNFDSFNQYAIAGVAAALNTIGTERLMTSTLDDPYGAYCFLCETVEYDEARTYAEFTLRDDVTFADGTPMTAHDVAFTNQLFTEQGIPEYRQAAVQFYDSVEVIDDHTIRFEFSDYMPAKVRVQQAGSTPVFSKAWFEETGARLDKPSETPFMSTGAYVLDEVDYNRRVVYRKNPDYWGAEHPLSQGSNNYETIRVEYFGDTSAALEAFKAGEYLIRNESDPADWNTGYDFPAAQAGNVVREEIPDGSVAQRFSWNFNLNREKWQDIRVRRAVAMMFNFEWSNDTLYFGDYGQPISFWTGTDLAADGLPTEGELALLQPLVDEGLLDAAILTEPARVPVEHSADSNQPARSIIREANRLLDEAGWELGEDGVRTKDGERLTLNFIQFNARYDRVITPFLANLALIGVDGELERMDTAQYVERRRGSDFDLTNQIFSMGFEPSTGLGQWFGSEGADESSRNIMRLKNEGVDRLLKEIENTTELQPLIDATNALDRTLRHLSFDIPYFYLPDTWVAYWDVYRHPDDLPPLGTGALDFWWVDAERLDALRASGAL
ncbi:extracellular solute-binding protein [Anianabacter salinae]|uniref:extracellular solute-binding protein n=1 Tax=Anianabacter salinae TaxID=2851023 RepID=UPI00225DD5B8|nr:extracellular solute-binding protein [Anianabacter salinae]MBV0913214.1 extracellular solute-binding protein [Anianabacter salinae]